MHDSNQSLRNSTTKYSMVSNHIYALNSYLLGKIERNIRALDFYDRICIYFCRVQHQSEGHFLIPFIESIVIYVNNINYIHTFGNLKLNEIGEFGSTLFSIWYLLWKWVLRDGGFIDSTKGRNRKYKIMFYL